MRTLTQEQFETKSVREREIGRAVQDRHMAALHRQFDLQAQGHTMKYERPQFAVVGEGTKIAQDKYRENYSKIDWSQ